MGTFGVGRGSGGRVPTFPEWQPKELEKPRLPIFGGEIPTEYNMGAWGQRRLVGWAGCRRSGPGCGHFTDSCLLTGRKDVALGSRTYSPGKFADLPAVQGGAGPGGGAGLNPGLRAGAEARWLNS